MFHFPVVAFRKELLHSVTDPQTKTEKEKKGNKTGIHHWKSNHGKIPCAWCNTAEKANKTLPQQCFKAIQSM